VEKSEQFFVLPGFARPVVVGLLLVVVLLVVAGVAGGVQVAAGCELQVLNIEVRADSSDVVTVSSQRVLMLAHVWAYTHQ
jgi:hypothetical protein